jgi:hypothetical protein
MDDVSLIYLVSGGYHEEKSKVVWRWKPGRIKHRRVREEFSEIQEMLGMKEDIRWKYGRIERREKCQGIINNRDLEKKEENEHEKRMIEHREMQKNTWIK